MIIHVLNTLISFKPNNIKKISLFTENFMKIIFCKTDFVKIENQIKVFYDISIFIGTQNYISKPKD